LKKALKLTGRILGVLMILTLLVAAGILLYFNNHKKELIARAGSEISHKIKAKVTIKNATINWFENFPFIAIALQHVQVIDTLYSGNSLPFLDANEININGNIFQLIKGEIHISNIEVNNGTIKFNRNADGKSNLHILDEQNGTKNTPQETLFDLITFKNIAVSITDISKQKDFSLLIWKLRCQSSFSDSLNVFNISLNTHLNYLGFNTKDGTYANGKTLEGAFQLILDTKRQLLSFFQITLFLDKAPVKADGIFHLDSAKKFHLQVSAPEISFENATSTLLAVTQATLKMFKIKKPLHIEADLSGDTKYKSLPNVLLTWGVKDDDLSTPSGIFTHASLSGRFINYMSPDKPRSDNNSQVTITSFDGLWNGISLVHSNQLVIRNLIHPFVRFDLQASCRLSDIDSMLQSDDISLEKGTAGINIVYEGPVEYVHGTVPAISGTVSLKNAEFQYIPRNLNIKNCSALLKFNKSEVTIERFFSKLGNSEISIEGHINSYAPLFTNLKSELLLQWQISSPSINLSELIPLLGQRNKIQRTTRKTGGALKGISKVIDDFADKCNIKAGFNIKKISYKKFQAQDAVAQMTLNNNTGWEIHSLRLRHADGTLLISGALTQNQAGGHSAFINATIEKADVSKVFYSFNNFGLKSLDYTNLRGKLSLVANLNVEFDKQANLLTNTIKGIVDFNLDRGELIDFAPIQEISQKIFPQRNFKDINFDVLKDHLVISDEKVQIDRMEIASNLLHFYLEGIYAFNNKGTNMLIQVPLKNILKPNLEQFPDNQGIDVNAGLSVYVHATNNSTGAIDFKYSLSPKPVKSIPQKVKKQKKKGLFHKKKKVQVDSGTKPGIVD
jgi:hypothetical protein